MVPSMLNILYTGSIVCTHLVHKGLTEKFFFQLAMGLILLLFEATSAQCLGRGQERR